MNQITEKIKINSKKIIAVASGKGGVGKSTVSANLALILARRGFSVGLLDADIYGPNIPLMLGLQNEKVTMKGELIKPVEKYGLKVVSVGFLTHPLQALIWRGPLANKLIEQFLRDVEWGKLDYLIIDLPPGTGDVPLSIVQKTELSGSLIVTIPSEASIADVQKMIDMFKKMNTKIIGMIENMSYLICTDCQKKNQLFPGNHQLNQEQKIKTLAKLPFDPEITIRGEDNLPVFLTRRKGITLDKYNVITDKVIEFK